MEIRQGAAETTPETTLGRTSYQLPRRRGGSFPAAYQDEGELPSSCPEGGEGASEQLFGEREGASQLPSNVPRKGGGSFPDASHEKGSFPAASLEGGEGASQQLPKRKGQRLAGAQKPRSLVGTKKYNILKKHKEKAYFRRVKPNLEFGDPTRSRRDHARDHPGPNILPAS